MEPANLHDLLLVTAFRHRIKESDAEEGRLRIAALTEREIDADAFRAAVGELLRAGLIYDPVNLPPGALQCHWRLELTPEGFEAAQAFGAPCRT